MARHDHYVMFFINTQARSSISFGTGSFATDGGEFGTANAASGGVQRGEKTTLTIKRAPTRRMSQAIALYMPTSVSVSHKANYGEQEIGAAVAGVLNTMDNISGDAGIGEILSDIGGQLATEGGKALLAAADQTFAPGALAAAEIMSGKITNNRTEMKFEGIDRRTFQFQFRMLPTSPEEAQTIEEIVTAFRFHAMPEFDGSDDTGRTMIPPSTFDIEYKPNQHLHRISTSVLESVDVQYGGERPQFFTDDHPVETSITLNFKELEIITKERIQAGY